ncbi:MAG: phage portal protein, partial [bacterium]
MTTATATWNAAQAKAATPGSAILTAWRAQREAERQGPQVKNVTYSESVLETFGAVPAASGMSVTPSTAMRVSAVFACVQRIAGGIASIPVQQFERTDGVRRQVENAPLSWLLNEQPTARYTAASMWEQSVAHMLLRGDGFAYLARDRGGSVREIIPLPWEAVQVERKKDGDTDRLVYYINDITRWGADQDDMLHFPGFGFNGLRSMSVIQWAARNAAGTAMAMDEYSGRFFAGGAHPSIVLEATGSMDAEQKASLREAFAAKYSGVENAHRLPLVLTEGIKATTLSVSAEDAQLLDARKFQVVDIARAFGVPPHLIGETSASTSWGSGLEELTRSFVIFTLQQHLKRIEQELNRKLFRTVKYFVEFNRDALMEANSKAQSEYFKAALGGPGSGPGWM